MVSESDTSLATELLRRAEADQEVRNRIPEVERELGGQIPWEHPFMVEWRAIDADNTAWLMHLIDTHGWPLASQVGTKAAEAAWLIAQHTPDHDFQNRCLGLMRDAVEHGEADPKYLAYLEDRVNVHHGRPQRYGTQWTAQDGGMLEMAELEDPARVDDWRANVGMDPIDECRPD
jgi:hypothetical protein